MKTLVIENLHVNVEGKEILKGVSLTVKSGEVHALMGPNGNGKSTLLAAVMGHPKYTVSGGSIAFEGGDITALPTFERARKGLFLSFQTPEEIPGITVENMLRTARQAITGKRERIFAFRKELKARSRFVLRWQQERVLRMVRSARESTEKCLTEDTGSLQER